jgi:SNF2 family DNA or RNA helicase
LHNWQQEVAKFLPDFKVVPYWGSPQERKILRHFWDQKNLHTRSASFHIVITSYQVSRSRLGNRRPGFESRLILGTTAMPLCTIVCVYLRNM